MLRFYEFVRRHRGGAAALAFLGVIAVAFGFIWSEYVSRHIAGPIVDSYGGTEAVTNSVSFFGPAIVSGMVISALLYVAFLAGRFTTAPGTFPQQASAVTNLQPITFMGGTHSLERNFSIRDLFFQVRPDMFDNLREKIWLVAGSKIKQALADGKLVAWGIPCDASGLKPDAFSEQPASVPISQTEWRRLSFSYDFFQPNQRLFAHVVPQNRHDKPQLYCDIQFNREQAIALWPNKYNGGHAGNWKNGWFIYNEPRQVFTSQFDDEESEDEISFHIGHIDTGSTIQYFVETKPVVTTWRFRLGHRLAELDKLVSGDDAEQATLDSNGNIKLLISRTTEPHILNAWVYVRRWRKPEA